MRTALAAAIDRLDLVSREDFEQQQAVLERATAKLAELEARLADMEPHRGGPPPPSTSQA
ncbi:MAG: accessory factor UbiK family protein [Burkholderiaceae bacterium]